MTAPDDILEAVTQGARHRMKREVEMTVYSITAELVDASLWGEPPGTRYRPGKITVHGRGQGFSHSWPIGAIQPWIGDKVTRIIDEPTEADDILRYEDDLKAWEAAEAKRRVA